MEQRRSKRFALKLPVAVIRSGTEPLFENGLTRNISSVGVLFTSLKKLDVGGPIEYVVTLPGTETSTVNIRCIGKVVRFTHVPSESEALFEVAATLERYEFQRPSSAEKALYR